MGNPYMINPLYDEENNERYDNTLRCGDMVVGMAYVPMQMWDNIYDMNEALARGTQFKDLDKPFFGEDIWK
ncbi:MAG: spore coat associated protein CotJA [Oscillospiraceae bacterium]|nr:spore coat associated protein CotJA [Oscillospiraceae bacterium]MBQ9986385.1 spore coat associated protein CotJA [Oscillospiraceae bacterium]